MARIDGDTWDLASSVGATATSVAASRALASKQPDPLITDPFADALVKAVGLEHCNKLADGELDFGDDPVFGRQRMCEQIAVRTRFFDDFFIGAAAAGIRQAVILTEIAVEFDDEARDPDGTVVYEIDQPQVIDFKTATMASLGASPAAERRTVPIDLREDWPEALRHSGFDPTAPTAWSAEGLLVYLPPDAQDRLFDDIGALSAPGSRLATEFHPDAAASIGSRTRELSKRLGDQQFDMDITKLFYDGERNGVVEYLSTHGWDVSARPRPEVFAEYGRVWPDTDSLVPLRDD